jgi:transcription antitermination factor NusG
MFITSTGDGKDIEYYADVMPHFEEGERVVVKDGIYKGLEGFVKRIKRDRKLLVALEGVAVVAISNIPIIYLEKTVGPAAK